jgi:hypothetical protein
MWARSTDRFSRYGTFSPRSAGHLRRTVLMKKDLSGVPGKEVTIFVAEYKPGGKVGNITIRVRSSFT